MLLSKEVYRDITNNSGNFYYWNVDANVKGRYFDLKKKQESSFGDKEKTKTISFPLYSPNVETQYV